jgi:uncharacterized protein YjiK
MVLSVAATAQYPVTKLKPAKKQNLKINEPSEIVFLENNKYLVLANKAFVYEMDQNGKVLKTIPYKGYDLEAACIALGKIYLMDEAYRTVTVMDLNYSVLKTHQIQYAGARNLSFEGMTFNPETNHFISATEKHPDLFYEFDQDFNVLNQFEIKGIREVSGLTYYKNKLYILSDEMHSVFKVNPVTYQILHQWKIPVINPEGISFDEQGNMLIISDDMNKLFTFNMDHDL